MKINQLKSLVITMIVAIVLVSCSGKVNSEEKAEAGSENTTSTEAVSLTIDMEASSVAWKGEVAGVYGHNGVINIKEGALETSNGKISGGSVVIDMTSIQPLDTASYLASGKTPQDLVDHLSTGDFFLVEEFPTASFVIKSHEGNTLTGDLTIRGNTNEETVELSSIEITENGVNAEGRLVFDRQKYDVKWEHYIKDYVLSNDIVIDLSIVASK